jgi:hypothetical protein
MKNFVIYVLFAVTMLSCTSIYKSHYPNPLDSRSETLHFDTDWIAQSYISPEDSQYVIVVTYDSDTVKCRAVFYSKISDRYKFVAPRFKNDELYLDHLKNIKIKKEKLEK